MDSLTTLEISMSLGFAGYIMLCFLIGILLGHFVIYRIRG